MQIMGGLAQVAALNYVESIVMPSADIRSLKLGQPFVYFELPNVR